MPDRRFRDMSLTEDEVSAKIAAYRERTNRRLFKYPRSVFHIYLNSGEARAKRLFPLWRQWGLQELSKDRHGIGETSLGRLEYKGPWSEWLSWFRRAPLLFPGDYNIVFRVTQPRKKRGAE